MKKELTDNSTIGEIKQIIEEFNGIDMFVFFELGSDGGRFNYFNINLRGDYITFNNEVSKIYDTLEYYKEKSKFKVLRKNIETLIIDDNKLEEVAILLKEKGVLK